MEVCLSMGKSSDKIISTLSRMADNVRFYSYDSIGEIVKDAKLRHLVFDRIVLSKSILNNSGKEFEELNSFIKEYNSNVEVVFVVADENDADMVKAFKRYFDAPMYAPVVLNKATSMSLLDLVISDISVVRSKYSLVDESEVPSENLEDSDGISTGNRDAENGTENEPSDSFGFGSGPSSVYTPFRGNSSVEWNSPEKEGSSFSEIEEDGGSSDGDDELSIGDLGGQHTDTGYLDDFDDAELAAKFEEEVRDTKQKRVSKDEVEDLDVSGSIDDVNVREKYEEKIIDSIHERYEKEKVISSDLNIDLVVSTGRCRCTQDMIDEALDLYRKDDAKVLIIDLDTTSNRVLSLLHMGRYYGDNCQEGITKQRVYVEDHIGVCSNGFGVPVTPKDLKALLASKLAKKFDLILLDCPVECLGIFDEELIRMCHVLVFSGGSLEDMADITLGLTNRSVVKLNVEKYIMRNCEVEIKGSLKSDDVNFLKENCLFANGCWLDKIAR